MRCIALMLAACVLVASPMPSNAAIVASFDSNLNDAAAFDSFASATDLVNIGQPTFSSKSTTVNPHSSFSFNGINDGVTGTDTSSSTFFTKSQLQSLPLVIFQLNTSLNAGGYDIHSIRSLAAWAGANITQANQKYELLIGHVGSPALVSYGTFAATPFTASGTSPTSTMLDIFDSLGTLATGVNRVAFRLQYPGFDGNNANPGTVYREIDVHGIPSSASALTNLVTNGSFETPAIGSTFQGYSSGNSIAGWTIDGNVTLARNFNSQPASAGAQWLSLEHYSATPDNFGTIRQQIATVPGYVYELRFDYTALGSDTVTGPWTLTYGVDGNSVTLDIPNAAQLTLAPWMHHAMQFTATDATSTIFFTGQTRRDGFYGPAIDNVAVYLAAVPEPSAFAHALFAVFSTALLAGRRRGRRSDGGKRAP